MKNKRKMKFEHEAMHLLKKKKNKAMVHAQRCERENLVVEGSCWRIQFLSFSWRLFASLHLKA
jgi:hypothetical protein